jgi:hypothetical protein
LKYYGCCASFEIACFSLVLTHGTCAYINVVPIPIVNVKTLVILSQLLCSLLFIPQIV